MVIVCLIQLTYWEAAPATTGTARERRPVTDLGKEVSLYLGAEQWGGPIGSERLRQQPARWIR